VRADSGRLLLRLKTILREQGGMQPLAGGHSLCQDCGIPVVVRTVLGSLHRPAVVVNATGCLEVATRPSERPAPTARRS
jgi:pyruvate ferredoxin oxidoreductase beta subunit